MEKLLIISVVILSAVICLVSGFSYCPQGCQCNDLQLKVVCGEGDLDVLPIALNPSIKELIIVKNSIKIIDSSIQFYSDLQVFDLSGNKLVNIPSKTFLYQRSLQQLHLNENKISSISNKTFLGLSSLKVLSMEKNFIEKLKYGHFVATALMEELNLGSNRISSIEPNTFNGLHHLRILNLQDNLLTTVPSSSFKEIPRLSELFLGINSFKTVPGRSFEAFKSLKMLSLRGVGMYNLSHDAFKGLESLISLDLSSNLLKKIPTVQLSSLGRLEELQIGQNAFEMVAYSAFFGLKNLKKIEITGSLKLKKIDNGAFLANPNLESINLSSNKMLVEIDDSALSGLPNLKHLTLKDNSLTKIQETLYPFSQLTTFDVSENPLACDCDILWLQILLSSANTIKSTISMPNLICGSGEPLSILTPQLMGCDFDEHRKQAMVAWFLVGSAASLTALALIAYKCKSKLDRMKMNTKDKLQHQQHYVYATSDHQFYNHHNHKQHQQQQQFVQIQHPYYATQPIYSDGARIYNHQDLGRIMSFSRPPIPPPTASPTTSVSSL